MSIAWESWISAGAAAVQAVGSIVILWMTHRIWSRSAQDELERTHAAADLFGSSVIATLAELRDACRTQQEDRIRQFTVKLTELIRFGRSIPIDKLPRKCMSDFFEALSCTVEAERKALERSPIGGYQVVEHACEYARNETSFLMGRIASHLRGWPVPVREDGRP